eukprot:g2554.t1
MASFPSAESKFKKPDGPAEPKRPTIAGFVSTAVLESDKDGLFSNYATEKTRDRSEEEERRLALQASADARPLYERLQEQREMKDAKWKEENNPFKAPQSLDEEDAAFLQEREERIASIKQQRAAQAKADIVEFAVARAQVERDVQSRGGIDTTLPPVLPSVTLRPTAAPAVEATADGGLGKLGGISVKSVRKRRAGDTSTTAKRHRRTLASPTTAVKATETAPAPAPAPAPVPAPAPSALGAIGAYGSNSSSSDSE